MFFKSWLGSKWANSARIFVASGLTLLTLVLVSGCTVTSTSGGTLVVNWTVVSTTDPNQCAANGASAITVTVTDASGVSTPYTASCADFTTSIDDIPAGTYSVSAQLTDASGSAISTPVAVIETITDGSTTTANVDFPAESFGGAASGLTVQWTVAGSASASACSDAGAATIDLALFDASGLPVGSDVTPACDAFSATIGVAPGAYTLTAKLVDASGNDATTTLTVQVTVTASGATQPIDFPADSFVTPTGGGAGAIDVTWEIASSSMATSCSDHNADSISIQLYDADGNPMGDPDNEPCGLFETFLTDIPAGDYEIGAQMVNNVGPVSTMIPPVAITVVDGQTTTQDFDFPTSSFTE
ncbi:MAG TPA: hypothetical protein VHV51_19755 [Polyangiaceae bacterium]|jgi:hypothetical protein|nr:hypothetical protein [Polyangiaceae bacterium]